MERALDTDPRQSPAESATSIHEDVVKVVQRIAGVVTNLVGVWGSLRLFASVAENSAAMIIYAAAREASSGIWGRQTTVSKVEFRRARSATLAHHVSSRLRYGTEQP
jgi:hypothetical protein